MSHAAMQRKVHNITTPFTAWCCMVYFTKMFDLVFTTLSLLLFKVAIFVVFNPLTPTAIQKLLEIVDRVHLYPSCSFATRSRLGHKPDYRLRWSSEDVRKSTYACRSVSVACRPAEKRRRRGEIGSIHRSILVGHRRPNRRQRVN